MPIIRPVRGIHPQIPEDCFIAENATIVGEVTMGNHCSIWFNAVIRGDVHFIKMGDKVNVQTRRGEISLMARQDPDVPEGMLFIPFCFVEAAANVLTNPKLDPYGKIPEFKFCAARVETKVVSEAAE